MARKTKLQKMLENEAFYVKQVSEKVAAGQKLTGTEAVFVGTVAFLNVQRKSA